MGILGERDGHATPERVLDYEIESFEVRQFVAVDWSVRHVRGRPRDSLHGQLVTQDLPRAVAVGDDRDVGGVALVARARVRELVHFRAHGLPSTTTRGLTISRGNSSDFTPSTSRSEFVPPPPPAGPLTCRVRISKPTACAALRSGLRAAMRSLTS